MKDQNLRMQWLDTAKAFGMLLVYIGHCHIPGWNKYIYLFHMPFFFIISGFLWNKEKNLSFSFKDYLRKKYKAYIIPYFKIATFCLIFYGILVNISRLGWGTNEYFNQLAKYLFGIVIYSRGTLEWLPNCSPIWFLTCLFVAETIFYFIMKNKYPLVTTIIAGLLGFILSGWIKLPWNIDNALTAVVLLYIGMQFRKYWHLLATWKLLLPGIILSIILIYTNKTEVDFDGNAYSSILAMYLKSSIITFSLLGLFYKLGGGGAIASFGTETLVLFGYNYMLNMIGARICPNNVYVLSLIVISLGIILVLIIKKYSWIKKIII